MENNSNSNTKTSPLITQSKSILWGMVKDFFCFKRWKKNQILYKIWKAFKNYIKSSFLSLFVILIIFLLTQLLEQSFTLFVALTEGDYWGLIISWLTLNLLAIALSHFPLYTYFAKNLNDSEKWFQFKKIKAFNFFPFFMFYKEKEGSINVKNLKPYVQSHTAHYLRYFNGLIIYGVWIYFIIKSYAHNFDYTSNWFPSIGIFVIILFLTFLVYAVFLKEKLKKVKELNDPDRLMKFYKSVFRVYIIIFLLTIISSGFTLCYGNISLSGFYLHIITIYLFVLHYFFFRFLRNNVYEVYLDDKNEYFAGNDLFNKALESLKSCIYCPFKWLFRFFGKPENYMTILFSLTFILSIVFIVYSTLASIHIWTISNGITVLLIFIYFYYLFAAYNKKIAFLIHKIKREDKRFIKIYMIVAVILSIWIAFSFFYQKPEQTAHELDRVGYPDNEHVINEDEFIDGLRNIRSETLFFISSQGGGLKSNVWTLNVLNRLQELTDGKLFEQTVALSGASGGSLGLGLYTALYKKFRNDFVSIQVVIDSIAKTNFTSPDLTMALGFDALRNIIPLNHKLSVKDRAYYSMLRYQNIIEDTSNSKLSDISFRQFWSEAFQTKYCPSLIMNTGGTNGKRGILWSVEPNKFNTIFHFATDLADLSDNLTLTYYQALSTTNRFPFFSPAAKIKHYGHYIDAGAIDNHGTLGCWDLYNYLLQKDTLLKGKTIVFIEIMNLKEPYMMKLIEDFLYKENINEKKFRTDFNEQETDNIIADINAGMNIQKIPGYMSKMISYKAKHDSLFEHMKFYMPHKVSVEDIESYLGGEIKEGEIKTKLDTFLREDYQRILMLTEGTLKKDFREQWKTYEPVLARHLSKNSLEYYKIIFEDTVVTKSFAKVLNYFDN